MYIDVIKNNKKLIYVTVNRLPREKAADDTSNERRFASQYNTHMQCSVDINCPNVDWVLMIKDQSETDIKMVKNSSTTRVVTVPM